MQYDVTDATDPRPAKARRSRDARRPHHNKQRANYAASADRPFCAWDGEGVDMGPDKPQAYCLLGNSEGGVLRAANFQYLTTDQCLTFLISERERLWEFIHVGFAIRYDSNMILRTVPFASLQRLHSRGSVTYRSWRISYRPGKYLMVTDIGKSVTIKIYDILGFWNMRAVDACIQDPRIGPTDERVQFIAPTKDERGAFKFRDLDSKVIPYFKVEMELYAELITNLREALKEVDLVPGEWFGPSAIISGLYKRQGLKRFMNRPVSDATRYRRRRHGIIQKPDSTFLYTLPDVVNRVALDSFFGGRFEPFKIGVHEGAAYEYDINSAYPYAMSFLPQLSQGRWVHLDKSELDAMRKRGEPIPAPAQFGFFRIYYRFADDVKAQRMWKTTGQMPPHPFAHRARDMSVSYPQDYLGWSAYWTAMYAWRNIKSAQFLEGWVWIPDNDFKPFASSECIDVQEMFRQRNAYGEAGRPDLKYVLKITLNSGYGKLAQTVGTEWGDNLPPYHQIEWAAHITDYCRARMLGYAVRAFKANALVSIETDALFTTEPVATVERDISNALGGIKRIDFDGLIYVQSGIYFTKVGDDWSFHYRGLDRDTWTAMDIRAYYETVDTFARSWPAIPGTNTVFNTATLSGVRFPNAKRFYETWLRWDNAERKITPSDPRLKRHHAHESCLACRAGLSPAQTFHDLTSKTPMEMISIGRKAEWLGDKLTDDEIQKRGYFRSKAVKR